MIAAVGIGAGGGIGVASGVTGAAIPVGRLPIFVPVIVLMCAGIGIRQWSVVLLGRLFTVDVRVHPDQPVIESGPYRWVRHPSYSGMILTFIGVGLALGNRAALAVLAVVPTAGLVVRIHSEGRALLDGVGEPYRRFADSRARLIPHVW